MVAQRVAVPLACVRVDQVAEGHPIPEGVQPAPCAWCQVPVYTSDSSRRLARHLDAVALVCLECARRATGPGRTVAMLSSDALRELEEWRQQS